MEDSITLWELIEITFAMGAAMFLIGRVAQILILKFFKIKWLNVFLIIALSLIVSFLLTLVVWRFWFFKFDVMYKFILIPTIFPELLITLLTWQYFKKI